MTDNPPILFLDIDGVLSPLGAHAKKESCFDAEAVFFVNQIIWTTKCKVVICSSWRNLVYDGVMSHRGFEYLLRTHGLDIENRIAGYTDQDDTSRSLEQRAEQIQRWIDEHRVERYAILDDEDLGYTEKGMNFRQVKDKAGVCPMDRDEARRMLNGEPPRSEETMEFCEGFEGHGTR